MNKICPKCGNVHQKRGTFCSRSCASKRPTTLEANAKRRAKLKGKTFRDYSPQNLETISKRIATVNARIDATPIEELGHGKRRDRVFKEQQHCCNRCGLSEWLGAPITLELEHKDGNRANNTRSNLEGLCPNCHSLTKTWRGRNNASCANQTHETIDTKIIELLIKDYSITETLNSLNILQSSGNIRRAKRLQKMIELVGRVGVEPTAS